MFHILALSGSLRAASLNSALLRVAARQVPPGISLRLFEGLGQLPLFNPDLEAAPGRAVQDLRAAVARADALIIASPEYAHGVSGVIKNALDWLVSCEPFAFKRVAVLNASPRASHADAALRETLRTMAADIVEEASLTIPLLGRGWDEPAMLQSDEVSGALRAVFAGLRQARR